MNGTDFWLWLLGTLLGGGLALGGYLIVAYLRKTAPLALAVVGYLMIATWVAGIFWVCNDDLYGHALFSYVCVGLLLLVSIAFFAGIHIDRDEGGYRLAVGHVTVLFGGAVLLWFGLGSVVPEIVASALFLPRVIGVVVLEVCRPFQGWFTPYG